MGVRGMIARAGSAFKRLTIGNDGLRVLMEKAVSRPPVSVLLHPSAQSCRVSQLLTETPDSVAYRFIWLHTNGRAR